MCMGNVSETPTPTACLKSTAVHLQFVRQYASHLYRSTFLASKLRRKGNPAIRLPFVLQYASHLYGSTRPICTAYFWKNTGVGVTGVFLSAGNVSKGWNLGHSEEVGFQGNLAVPKLRTIFSLQEMENKDTGMKQESKGLKM